jgi:hypothetical protein
VPGHFTTLWKLQSTSTPSGQLSWRERPRSTITPSGQLAREAAEYYYSAWAESVNKVK